MFKEDGEVLHFASPKVQASVGANTYVPWQLVYGTQMYRLTWNLGVNSIFCMKLKMLKIHKRLCYFGPGDFVSGNQEWLMGLLMFIDVY